MKIVLWAYHEAGYRTLRKLHAGKHELLVFTEECQPHVPSVRQLAGCLDLPVHTGAGDRSMQELIRYFKPDLGLCMFYPHIITKAVLDLPRLGAFNFHPSLLPRHRGCFSAPWAIIEGDDVTGVTCHEMVPRVDSGKILCDIHVPVEQDDTAFSLYYKLVDAAVLLLDEAMHRIMQSKVDLAEQAGEGCYHRREVPFAGLINTEWPLARIERFIRAMYFPPHQPATLLIGTKKHPVYSIDEYRQLTGSRN